LKETYINKSAGKYDAMEMRLEAQASTIKNARGRDKRKSVLEGTGNRRNVHRHVQKMPQQRQTLKPIILRIPKLANANITSCDCIYFPLQMCFAEFSGAYKCFCVFFYGLYLTSEVIFFWDKKPPIQHGRESQVAALQAVAQVTQVGPK